MSAHIVSSPAMALRSSNSSRHRLARFHHLGFWTSDLTAGTQRLIASGFSESFSGCPYGRRFAYHHLDSIGADIELVDLDLQFSFLETWSPGAPSMPAINEATE